MSHRYKSPLVLNTQEEHHAKISFAEEWRRILERHGIAEFNR